eukprot:COSAG04_NODE_1088_length_8335_cov_16.006071_4_plen_211_part_00
MNCISSPSRTDVTSTSAHVDTHHSAGSGAGHTVRISVSAPSKTASSSHSASGFGTTTAQQVRTNRVPHPSDAFSPPSSSSRSLTTSSMTLPNDSAEKALAIPPKYGLTNSKSLFSNGARTSGGDFTAASYPTSPQPHRCATEQTRSASSKLPEATAAPSDATDMSSAATIDSSTSTRATTDTPFRHPSTNTDNEHINRSSQLIVPSEPRS